MHEAWQLVRVQVLVGNHAEEVVDLAGWLAGLHRRLIKRGLLLVSHILDRLEVVADARAALRGGLPARNGGISRHRVIPEHRLRALWIPLHLEHLHLRSLHGRDRVGHLRVLAAAPRATGDATLDLGLRRLVCAAAEDKPVELVGARLSVAVGRRTLRQEDLILRRRVLQLDLNVEGELFVGAR